MKFKGLIIIAFFLSFLSSYSQEKKTLDNIGNENTNQAEFNFAHEEFDFGTIPQGESITHEFNFTNSGVEPLIISKAEGSCGCTVPIYSKEPIMKNQTGIIKVTFNSTGKSGVQDRTVTITSNAKRNPLILHLKGSVEKPIDNPSTNSPKN